MSLAVRALFLVGPTATGKTALALDIAERIGAEIVSCDSRQIYRGMAVGTAAPTAAEQARVPHHLVGMADPTERWNAGRFADAAMATVRDIASRGRAVLLVGGSGLYVRAIRHGLAPLPRQPETRAAVIRQLEAEGPEALHAELAAIDPDTAAKIHPRNGERLVRALELVRVGGPLAPQFRDKNPAAARLPAPIYAIGLDRDCLYDRVNARVPQMVDGGWTAETEALLARGFDPSWPAYRTLGYPEMVGYVRDGESREITVDAIRRHTRRFAKRQETWFRHQPDVRWLSGADEAEWLSRVAHAVESAPPLRW